MAYRKSFMIFLWVSLGAACTTPAGEAVLADHPSLRANIYDQTIDLRNIDYPTLQAACFLASNEARIKNNQKILAHQALLETAARDYALTMAREQFLAHEHPTDASQKDPEIRAKNAGVNNPYVAENIALIQTYPVPNGTPVYVRDGGFSLTSDGPVIGPHTYQSAAEAAVQGWLDSPGHRRNLLSPDALELGCGAALTSQGDMPMFILVQNFQLYEKVSQ